MPILPVYQRQNKRIQLQSQRLDNLLLRELSGNNASFLERESSDNRIHSLAENNFDARLPDIADLFRIC